MNSYKIVIDGRLPALNDYIRACRGNKYAANAFKRRTQQLIWLAAKSQYTRSTPVYRAFVIFHFYEPNMRRDPDNVSGYGRKAILDGLVECGVLAGDRWKNIAGLQDDFQVDSKHPRIEVEILEVEP